MKDSVDDVHRGQIFNIVNFIISEAWFDGENGAPDTTVLCSN